MLFYYLLFVHDVVQLWMMQAVHYFIGQITLYVLINTKNIFVQNSVLKSCICFTKLNISLYQIFTWIL